MTYPVNTPVHLSPRQRDALALMAGGLSRAQAAEALGVKRSTVDTLYGEVFLALHARTAAQAVQAARERGLIAETGAGQPPT